MFQPTITSVQRLLSTYDPLSTNYKEALQHIAQNLPEAYTLQQIYESFITAQPAISDFGALLAIDTCLADKNRLKRSNGEVVFSSDICSWTASKIIPGSSLVPQDEYFGGDISGLRKRNISEFQMSACAGTSIINELDALLDSSNTPSDMILLSLLSFTDERDPWTASQSYHTAAGLLSKYERYVTSNEFLIEYLLKATIRPLFQKSRPSTITDQGRKAVNQDAPDRYAGRITDPASKPWKFERPATTTLFRWAIANTSVILLSENWHLFIPPLLTIMDDPTTEIRARGCELLVELLSITPSRLLNQTGLGDVFEDAIMPTLLYLPSLTPVDESLRLLPPAYKALYALADIRFPGYQASAEKIKMFDRILRQGVLRGFFHVMENVRVVEVLLQEMGIIVQKMGLDAVKHLKDLVPIIVGILMDPLGSSHTSNLLAATKTTQLLILSCWPRISEPIYRVHLIQALTLCWDGISDDVVTDTASGAGAVKKELRVAAQLLLKSVKSATDVQHDLQPLLELDGTLYDLFGLNLQQEHTG